MAHVLGISVNDSLHSAIYSVLSVENEQLYLEKTVPEFNVRNGDSVRVLWSFSGDETLDLLYDGQSPAVGAQVALVLADPKAAPYNVRFGITVSLRDKYGVPLISGSEPSSGHRGGDITGGVTLNQNVSLEVAEVLMELSDFTSLEASTFPLAYSGVRLTLYNAHFGAPLLLPSVVSEPSVISIWVAVLSLWASSRYRRCRQSSAPNRTC